MKIVLIIIVIVTVVAANPQFGFGGFGVFGGGGIFPNSQFYQSLLQRDLQKLLTTPDFPEDLAIRAVETIQNSNEAFENCDSAAYPLPYMQRICIVQAYSAARNALSSITQEYEARVQATTNSSASLN